MPVTYQPYAAATRSKNMNGTASATTTARILMILRELHCSGFSLPNFNSYANTFF
jgi:hypothetical protein